MKNWILLNFFQSNFNKILNKLSAPDGPHAGPMNFAIRGIDLQNH